MVLRGWRGGPAAAALLVMGLLLLHLQPGTVGAIGMEGPVRGVRGPSPGSYPWLRPGQVIWNANVHSPMVALTFDDGPIPGGTRQVLQVLRKHRARATFFLIGKRVEQYQDIAREIQRGGHEIGNHGYNHQYLQFHTSTEIADDLRQTGDLIAQVTGQAPKLFRPPGGGIYRNVITVAQAQGYRTILWSWDTRDWTHPGVTRMVRPVVENVLPGDIILFHDGQADPRQTVAAVDSLLTSLEQRGYRFVTVSELLMAQSL